MKERNTDNYTLIVAIAIFIFFIISLLAGSCHTIHGVGKDLQDVTKEYVERGQ
jgi:predicted small secreted protein